MNRWSGRVALVTGASVGIGAAICRKLVQEGMKVVGAARNVDKVQALAAELKTHPGSLMAVKCDITKDDQVLSLFSTIKKELGGVDVCINNAGMSHNHSLLDGTPEEWREMLDTNVVALCLCTKEAVASMRERGVDDGHIIHINSTAGHRVSNNPAAHFYSSTKFAAMALTEGLRQELRALQCHIRVSAISPGYVETEFFSRMLNDEVKGREVLKQMPHLQPEDVADTVLHVLAAPPRVQIHDVLMRPTDQIA